MGMANVNELLSGAALMFGSIVMLGVVARVVLGKILA